MNQARYSGKPDDRAFLFKDYEMPQGKWQPPQAGKNAPKDVQDILDAVYSNCRDSNPAETPQAKAT